MITKKNKSALMACLLGILALISCNNVSYQNGAGFDTISSELGFEPMLNPNSLEGWEGDTTIWTIKDGILTGEIKPDSEALKNNTFLIWTRDEPSDFELKGQFRVSSSGNSGINYRSDRFESVPYALKGYQADIDGKNNYTGQNYEERKRTTLAYRGQVVEVPSIGEGTAKSNAWTNVKILDSLGNREELRALIKSEDWNEIRIVANGTKLEHYINGILMSSVDDKDPNNSKLKGFIGLQVHVGPPMKVEYKDLEIKKM